MKLKILALSIISTGVFAGNAVLDVQGQIQINGETVIGSDGKIAATALPNASTSLISLDRYSQNYGTYTYEFVNEYYNGMDYVTEKCTEVDNYISDTKYEYSQECVDENDVVTNKWHEVSELNGDEETLVSTWLDWDGQEITSTRVNKIEVFSKYLSEVPFGTKTGHYERGTILSSDNEWDNVGGSWFYAGTRAVAGFIESIELAGNNYSDCVIIEHGRSFSDSAMISMDIYCKGYGRVVRGDRVDYQLVSYEPHSQNTSYAKVKTLTNTRGNALGEKARARAEQQRPVK